MQTLKALTLQGQSKKSSRFSKGFELIKVQDNCIKQYFVNQICLKFTEVQRPLIEIQKKSKRLKSSLETISYIEVEAIKCIFQMLMVL